MKEIALFVYLQKFRKHLPRPSKVFLGEIGLYGLGFDFHIFQQVQSSDQGVPKKGKHEVE